MKGANNCGIKPDKNCEYQGKQNEKMNAPPSQI